MNITIPHHYRARDYQVPLLREIEKSINGKSDIQFFYYIWHRRAGKDKTAIADPIPRRLIKDACLVKYVYPTLVMGRDNLWDGIGSDGFRYIDHLPQELRADRPNKSRMTVPVYNQENPDTPSIFQVAGSDNPDSLRGGNAKMYVFSEWAEQDPYAFDVIEPIIRENGGIAIFNTTPKGDNHARTLMEFAKNNPKWYVETRTAHDTKVFSEKQLEEIYKDILRRFEADGRSRQEADTYFEQEYLCSFDSPVIGSYYGAALMKAEKEGRITHVPHNEGFNVFTYWDLGMDDSMTIWFLQVIGKELHFIDYYENSGEGFAHYAKVLRDKPYIYGKHFAPFDIAVRELGTGKSRLEVARNLGIRFETAPKLSIEDGINAARSLLSRCWFDSNNCSRGIQALKNYSKDWDVKNKVFRNNPKHDWSSHGADGFRTFAVTFKETSGSMPKQSLGGVNPYYEDMPG